MSAPEIWLVYSREHNAWWRPKAAGYTNHIEAAGRYTKADADRHCGSRDFADHDNPPEVACIAPETAAELERAQETIADLLKALKLALDESDLPDGNRARMRQIMRDAISRATTGTGAQE